MDNEWNWGGISCARRTELIFSSTLLDVADWFRSINCYSHLSRKARRRLEQLKLLGLVKRGYSKKVSPCNFSHLALCKLLMFLPWLPRKPISQCLFSQSIFCLLDHNPIYSSSFFCLNEVWGWFLMGYPGQGLCQSLAVIKTRSGITDWLLQDKHWVILSGWGGRNGKDMEQNGSVGLISLMTTHSTLMTMCWTEYLQWLHILYLMREKVHPDPSGTLSSGFALHRTCLKWILVLGPFLWGEDLFEMITIDGIHQTVHHHLQKPNILNHRKQSYIPVSI